MNQSYNNDKCQGRRISAGHEKCDSVTFCFYIVSLPGHSISKYISFSNYRWQYLYCFCLMVLLLAWELFVGGTQKWEDKFRDEDKEPRFRKQCFPQKISSLLKTK